MVSSSSVQTTHAGPARRALRTAILAGLALFVSYTALKALGSPWAVDDFPEALAIKAELMPVIFPLHMISGGLALVLVPLALLARRWPRWHKLAGRIAAADVAVAGLTAFPVALIAPVTWGSALGFSAQGAVWLGLLALGIANIRRRRPAAHRAAMLLMAATTSGAVFFRVYLALYAMIGGFRHYELFYAFDAWIAWSLPLLAMAIWLKRSGASPFDPR
ncbi:DUF2306 domain-containing protein [Novosphingobium sp.]|uniref:DUF2306 domain-containing protein n=1 Tax=Novosphingobium sp. TaxID=1874826 RepID=UPI00286CC4BC|nr:DUF2306 domain-containing protein [Novosphingobium sp.]